jgi:prevent-host-death family protein
MLDMKRASLRQVQHHLSDVMKWVDEGEEVEITRRNRTVAKLVPARPAPSSYADWSGHEEWLKRTYPHGPLKGSPVSDLVIESRGRD